MATEDRDRALAAELCVGMVVHLDPHYMLAKGGAKPTGSPQNWVIENHFFLCLEISGKRCKMLPLFSTEGPGRSQLPQEGRTGHAKWTDNPSYYHPAQVWELSVQGVVEAAWRGGDKSRSGTRKLLRADLVPGGLPRNG